MAGDSLAALGVRALVITGARRPGDPAILVIDEDGARLEDGSAFLGARRRGRHGGITRGVWRRLRDRDDRPRRGAPTGRRRDRHDGRQRRAVPAGRPRRAGRGDGQQGFEGDLDPAHPRYGEAPGFGPVGHRRVSQAGRAQRTRPDAAAIRHRLHAQPHATPGRPADAQFQPGPVRGRRGDRRRGAAGHDPGARRGRHADRGVHDGLRDPMQQHLRRCGGQPRGRAARVRDVGAVRVKPRAGFAGRHRPHQPDLQRSGPGHHRDRRGAGRDDGGREVWRIITPQSTHRMHCRVSETASARRRSSPESNTAIR